MIKVIGRQLDGGCVLYAFPRAPAPHKSLPMPMGKYRGVPIADVAERDPDYIGWLIGQDWFPLRYPCEAEAVIDAITIDPYADGPSAA